jgi:hypothetical protein
MRWWLVVVRVASSVPAARIYREDPPRVIASRNQLGLFLSKRIRYRLVAKINGERRSRTCEALGQILADYSRARCASVPSPHDATPYPTPPGEVRRDERTLVFLPFSAPSHICKCIESNKP